MKSQRFAIGSASADLNAYATLHRQKDLKGPYDADNDPPMPHTVSAAQDRQLELFLN